MPFAVLVWQVERLVGRERDASCARRRRTLDLVHPGPARPPLRPVPAVRGPRPAGHDPSPFSPDPVGLRPASRRPPRVARPAVPRRAGLCALLAGGRGGTGEVDGLAGQGGRTGGYAPGAAHARGRLGRRRRGERVGCRAGSAAAGQGQEGHRRTSPVDPSQQAFLALVLSTLLPAVLASLYLSPPSLVPPVCPSRHRPVLSAIAHRYLSWNDRATRIDDIKRLRGGKLGKGATLDLDEVEREASETIEALEVKLGDEDPKAWYGGASSPTRLDALLYALLSIASVLPPSCDKVLRPTLERSPRLLAWVKAHDP